MSTNAQLTQQIGNLLTAWNEREAQFRAWLAGTATGGPNGDGRYPLTNASGDTQLVDCPAKLSATVGGPAALAEAAKQLTETARDVTIAARDRAVQAENAANTMNSQTVNHRDMAKVYRDDAAAYAAGLQSGRDAALAAQAAAEAARDGALESETNAAASEAGAASSASAAAASAALAATFEPSQFFTKTQADARFKPIGYVPSWSEITGKPLTFTPSAHTHVIADVAGLQSALDGKQAVIGFTPIEQGGGPLQSGNKIRIGWAAASNGLRLQVDTTDFGLVWPISVSGSAGSVDWANITSKPSTFTPSSHGHSISEVSGLQAALDGKQAAGSYAAASHGHTIGDVSGLQAALDAKASLTAPVFTGLVSVGKLICLQPGDGEGGEIVLQKGSAMTNVAGNLILDAVGNGFRIFEDGGSYRTWTFDVPSGNIYSSVKGAVVSFEGHGHTISDVTGLQAALDGKQPVGSYAAAIHGHTIGDVSGLQAALDSKQPVGSYAAASHTHSYLSLSGGTLTGGLTVAEGIGQIGLYASDGAVEITRSGGGAYIDFKDAASDDYDVRIYQTGDKLGVTGGIAVPIMFDGNNWDYFVDPDGVTRLNRLTWTGQVTNPGTMNHDWDGGYYHFSNTQNTPDGNYGHAHIIRLDGNWSVQQFWPTGNTDMTWFRKRVSGSWAEWHSMLTGTTERWNASSEGKGRFWFSNWGRTHFGTGNGYEWRNSGDANVMFLNDGGDLSIRGQLTVNEGQGSSYIKMWDSDEGSRFIHSNSDRIGFLSQVGGWGAYCNDNGDWQADGTMYVYGGSKEVLATTSGNRPGVTRLYRRDEDSNYSVQTNWNGAQWVLAGYNGDSYHAPCRVGVADYADYAGTVDRTADNVIVAAGTQAIDDVWSGPIEIREVNRVGNGQTGSAYAPALTFHWSMTTAAAIKMFSDGSLRILGQGTSVNYRNLHAANVYDNSGRVLSHSNAGYGGGKVTVSTSDPSGGTDGDIWFKV